MFGLALVSACCWQAVAAQEAAVPLQPATPQGAASAAPPGSTKLEEIVVTANYRAQAIQDVVGSAQAFSGAALDKAGVAGMQDYLLQVPSVSFQPSGNGMDKIGMRGISNINTSDLGYGDGSPTVGVYLDDVAIQGSGVMPDLRIFDLDRIEVLKGPQGTLYGEGSMGGAIKMVTNAPDASGWEFRTDDMYSETSHGAPSHEARAAVNVPLISDTLAARIVGTSRFDGGFVDYTTLNRPDANGAHSDSLRAILNYRPLDWLNLHYMFLYNNDKRDQFPVVDQGAQDQLTNSAPENQYADTRFTIQSLTGKVELPFASLTEVSAYYRTYRDSVRRAPVLQSLVDTQFLGTGLTAPVLFTNSPTHVTTDLDSFSEELRLVSKGEHAIDWIAGAFYRDRGQTFVEQKYENSVPDVSVLQSLFGLLNLSSFDPLQGLQENGNGDEKFRQLAAYGEATWNIIPSRLELTAGLRVFTENVSFVINTQFYGVEAALFTTEPQSINLQAGGPVVHFAQGLDTKGILPKLSLGWHVTDQNLLYATISRGFRSGTPNVYSALSAGPPIVNPDYVWNKEVGYKGTWFGGHLITDLSAFDIDWQHLQGTVLGEAMIGAVPTQFAYLANAGNARVLGAEEAITWAPLHGLTLNLNGGYNYGVITSSNPASGVVNGTLVPNTPRFTGSFNASYVKPLPFNLKGDISTGYTYVGSQLAIFVTSSTNTLGQTETGNGYPLGSYGLLKASVGLARGTLHVQLFGDNLLDRRVITAISAPLPQYTILTPRVVGIRASYDF
jgi:outer membrane receptor protein involved in Fe transport